VVVRQKRRSYEITCSWEWFVAFGVCVESIYCSDFLEEKKERKGTCAKITKAGGDESCERVVD